MSNYKCRKCGKVETQLCLPYQWSSIHEESSGVHDSANVMYKHHYYLCPDCRMVFKEVE